MDRHMKDATFIIKEARDTVNELLNDPDNNRIQKLQYKLMMANLGTLLYVATRIKSMHQSRKTR